MQIKIEISKQDLKRIIKNYIEEKTNQTVEEKDISILTKSAQNFKSEWEVADFKAEYNTTTKF